MNATTRALVASDDKSAAEEFDSLPSGDAVDAEALEGDDIEEGVDDASKAPANTTLLMQGGIQMALPSDWLFTSDQDGFVFDNPAGTVIGWMYSYAKADGASLDVEQEVKCLPVVAKQNGYTNIEVIAYETLYSSKGTLASARICYAATYQGVEYIFFAQMVESKSFYNVVELVGETKDFAAELQTLGDITDSIAYNDGETI